MAKTAKLNGEGTPKERARMAGSLFGEASQSMVVPGGGLGKLGKGAGLVDDVVRVGKAGASYFPSRKAALRQAKRDAGVPVTQKPIKVEHVAMKDRTGSAQLRNGKPTAAREYYFTEENGKIVVIQEHMAGHVFPDGGREGPHFNVRPAADTRHGKVPGTKSHYYIGEKWK